MQIEYLGKKLVKANEALGQYKGKFYHTVAIYVSSKSNDTAVDTLALVDTCMELDKWVQETFGYSAYSILPSDDGTWFKFLKKEHAMQFKLRFS